MMQLLIGRKHQWCASVWLNASPSKGAHCSWTQTWEICSSLLMNLFSSTLGDSEDIKRDGVQGVLVCYCFKYKLGGAQGVELEKAGICFRQHLDNSSHLPSLLSLAAKMKSVSATFSTKIACMQASQAQASSSYTGDAAMHDDDGLEIVDC